MIIVQRKQRTYNDQSFGGKHTRTHDTRNTHTHTHRKGIYQNEPITNTATNHTLFQVRHIVLLTLSLCSLLQVDPRLWYDIFPQSASVYSLNYFHFVFCFIYFSAIDLFKLRGADKRRFSLLHYYMALFLSLDLEIRNLNEAPVGITQMRWIVMSSTNSVYNAERISVYRWPKNLPISNIWWRSSFISEIYI